MARNQLQPGQRAAGEIARRHEIDRDPAGHRRQHEADQSHVVIERQPGGETIALGDFQAVLTDRAQVGHHRPVRHRDRMREARAAGRELQVGQIVSRRRRQLDLRGLDAHELADATEEGQLHVRGRFAHPAFEGIRRDDRSGADAFKHAADVLEVGLLAAERDWQRQRRRHQPGHLAGEERAHEIAIGVGQQADAVAMLQSGRQQPPGQAARLFEQARVRQRFGELAAPGIEVKTRRGSGRAVQRMDQIVAFGAVVR